MSRAFRLVTASVFCASLFQSAAVSRQQLVFEVAIDGPIVPITTEVLTNALQEAEHRGAALVLVRLSTPGGLSEAMRECVAKLVASKIPVATLVAPGGARAASAGFFLLEAGDIAAMAPGTNTGAAHPVILGQQMDPVMKEKLENDAAALLRSVTTQRGRNAEMAETAVRASKSFTETEALAGKLIDAVAHDERDLLNQINGRTIKRFNGTSVRLQLDSARVENYEPSFRARMLQAISDPNIALILLAIGALGIYAEFAAPGLIFPGVVGAVFALLGLAALSVLPLNWLGGSLLILAALLFVLELKVPSHGILSTGGAVAMVLGATMLVDAPIPELRIRLGTALGVVLPIAALAAFLVTLAVRAQRNKVVTGAESMLGAIGVAVEDLAPEGRVFVHGEYWQASAEEKIPHGAGVRVKGIEQLRLRVVPASAAKEML